MQRVKMGSNFVPEFEKFVDDVVGFAQGVGVESEVVRGANAKRVLEARHGKCEGRVEVDVVADEASARWYGGEIVSEVMKTTEFVVGGQEV